MPTEFENEFKDIEATELWQLFSEKVKAEKLTDEFKTAVGKVCEFGIIQSKAIIKFLPNFTLHDITHIKNVCKWMTMLLGERKNDLTARETAMLLMSACCHDIGMSVTDEQQTLLEEDGYTTGEKQREYVRKHHHERVKEHITPQKWIKDFSGNTIFQKYGIRSNELIALCKSHGESLENLEVPNILQYNLRICAILLRLADILDFDSTRAPQALFEHMGLDSPESFEREISSIEWIKNRSGNFRIANNTIIYNATYDDPNIEHKLNDYLKWVKQELNDCTEYLSKFAGNWNNFRFPYRVEQNVERIGYKSDDFKLTMNQDRIIELLTGENLYSDPCVFVRELLQNSIDAILWRDKNDPYFDAKEDGKIKITSWYDQGGQSWFRIEDNGTGMDENIIMNYFLKAGNSYYISDDFEEEHQAYSPNESYKPISRFGIGILSCFMSNKNNKLEISTKRYSHNPRENNAGIRLSVTSLNGYYTLATQGEESTADWQKMPVQDHEKPMRYRREPGTTICVGMNLFNLGEYRNIREVVDKYVKFPDIKVEYDGPEGNKEYPTKVDFLNAVNEFKKEYGDTYPIVCRHSIPDEAFEQLKKDLLEFEFESTPELIITYYPLDNFTSGDNLCGICVDISLNINYKQGIFEFKNVSYELELSTQIKLYEKDTSLVIIYSVDFPDKLEDKLNNILPYPGNKGKTIKAYNRLDTPHALVINFDTLYKSFSSSEKKVFETIIENNLETSHGIIAYNGVFADKLDIVKYNSNSRTIILLGGNYAPDVNVARNKISNLPIECVFELESILKTLKNVSSYNYYTPIPKKHSSEYFYLTEKKLYELTTNHPEWEEKILIEAYSEEFKEEYASISKIDEALKKCENVRLKFLKKSLYDNIALLFLKKHYILCANNYFYQLADKKEGFIDTSDFPVQLFAKFPESSNLLGIVNYSNINTYSPEHRFSKWLIENREKLQKELPELYRKILEIMIMSNSKNEVIEALNTRLEQLKGYKSNIFNVTDQLLLNDLDLK
ncbi:MAG: ATP-binding protein [Acutalibacteraceae bacterium]|nr:ATP-binding protein [Acutalibacteraceae bacterium]